MSEILIDLYSDTHTQPTDEMRKFMAAAEVGDEQQQADPTVNKLVEMVCELLDRREILREEFLADPTERKVNMSLLETEKLIQTSLSLLGFTPSDRSKLGLAEVKAKSKLEELMERRANRDIDAAE